MINGSSPWSEEAPAVWRGVAQGVTGQRCLGAGRAGSVQGDVLVCRHTENRAQ